MIGAQARLANDFLGNVADLQHDFHGNFVSWEYFGCYVELDADIEIGHRLRLESRSLVKRRGYHRNLVADQDVRLLPVLDPDLRFRKDIGAAQGPPHVHRHQWVTQPDGE
ncbi:hypothetical protein D9M70_445030 [compost metagenome]